MTLLLPTADMGPNEVDTSLLSTIGKDSDNPYDTAMPGVFAQSSGLPPACMPALSLGCNSGRWLHTQLSSIELV